MSDTDDKSLHLISSRHKTEDIARRSQKLIENIDEEGVELDEYELDELMAAIERAKSKIHIKK